MSTPDFPEKKTINKDENVGVYLMPVFLYVDNNGNIIKYLSNEYNTLLQLDDLKKEYNNPSVVNLSKLVNNNDIVILRLDGYEDSESIKSILNVNNDDIKKLFEKIEPVAAPAAESVAEPVTEPVAEFVTEPVTESIAESVTEPVTEPVAESAAESVVESVAEPVVESVVEPVANVDENSKKGGYHSSLPNKIKHNITFSKRNGKNGKKTKTPMKSSKKTKRHYTKM